MAEKGQRQGWEGFVLNNLRLYAEGANQMQNGEAKTNINSLFFASFLAGGFPHIISCILHNNRAWHATQFCFTSVESGGSKSGVPEQARKQARTSTESIHPPHTPRCHWMKWGKGSSYWEGRMTTCVSHFKNYHQERKFSGKRDMGPTHPYISTSLDNHLPEYFIRRLFSQNQVKASLKYCVRPRPESRNSTQLKSINKHSLNVHSVPSTMSRYLRPKDRGDLVWFPLL